MADSTMTLPLATESETYRGYDESDVERVTRFKNPTPAPAESFLLDYFGVKTRTTRASWIAGLSGVVLDQPPFPRDGFLAEGVEYAAATLALEQSQGPTFTSVEIGAGWGPWTALMGVLAARQGFTTVNAIAVEASPKRFAMMQSHLADNGMLPNSRAVEGRSGPVRTQAIRAAGWWKKTTMYFPAGDSEEDAGMAATDARTPTDYRGNVVEHVAVPAVSIPDLCKPFDVVDFMHVDIQGGEWELISKAKAFFDAKVRFLFVGTHNRKIEGDLIELMMSSGWKLFREKPCRFYGMADSATLTGLTYEDGAQLWRNMRLP